MLDKHLISILKMLYSFTTFLTNEKILLDIAALEVGNDKWIKADFKRTRRGERRDESFLNLF